MWTSSFFLLGWVPGLAGYLGSVRIPTLTAKLTNPGFKANARYFGLRELSGLPVLMMSHAFHRTTFCATMVLASYSSIISTYTEALAHAAADQA